MFSWMIKTAKWVKTRSHCLIQWQRDKCRLVIGSPFQELDNFVLEFYWDVEEGIEIWETKSCVCDLSISPSNTMWEFVAFLGKWGLIALFFLTFHSISIQTSPILLSSFHLLISTNKLIIKVYNHSSFLVATLQWIARFSRTWLISD